MLIYLLSVDLLTVGNGATLNSLTNTAFDIAQTNIGDAVNGGGTLILDSEGLLAAINVLNGKALSFEHANSLLKLTNVTNANHATFTLQADIAPGGGADLKGNLEISATNNKTITITPNGGETIGTDKTHRLENLLISGDQAVIINTGVHAKNITISSTANVTLGAVDSGVGDATQIKFTADGGILALTQNVTTKTIDINDKTRTITVANGVDLNLDDITNGANSQMTFLGNGNLNLFGGVGHKTVNIGKIIAGANAATVILGQGTYTGEVRVANAGGTVKLADGFNLIGGFNTTGGAAGIVKFLGNAQVSGALGTGGNALGAVTVDGASTLQVGGDITVASLDGTAGLNAQNLKFINGVDIEVAGAVGGNQQFTQIEFNRANVVEFKNLQSTNGKTLNFTADATVVAPNYDLGTTNIIGAGAGKLTIDIDQAIIGDITNFGTLHIIGDKTVNINTANFAASITTGLAANGIVNFNVAGADPISVGVGARVKELNFNAARTVGDVHAENISIRANGTATFTDVIDANQIKFSNAATSIAHFGARNLTTLLVSDGGTGKGIANFVGTGIQSDVGAVGVRLAQANFAAANDSAINANVYADAINVNGTITMTKAATFDGATTFNAATIALAGNDLTFNNGAVAFKGNSIITTRINGNDLGNLVAGAGGNITVNGKIEIQVDPLPAIPNNGQKVTLIKKDGGTLNVNIADITVTKHGGAFAQWRKELDANGNLVLTNEAQVNEVLNQAAQKADLEEVVTPEITQAIEDAVPGTQGADIRDVFNTFLSPDGSRDEFALADGVARLTNTTANEIVGATFETVSTMNEQINARMFDVGSFASSFAPAPDVSNVGQSQGASFTPAGNQPARGAATTSSPAAGSGSRGSGSTNVDAPANKAKSTKVSANELSGIAAGDDSDRYGIWATPFYSKSTQKKRGSSAGYKSDGYGGTFGFDTRANEEMVVGLAVTAMNSDIKHKDFKSGDKTKVGTMLFSVYSNYQFGNNWFGQGVFSIGSSNVTNKEKRRISTTNYSIASAEYSSMTFASEVLGGYNHLVNNQLVLTPMFGLGYSRINDSSYQETGTGPQLLSVTKRASQKVELVGGLRVTGLPFIVGEVSLTPEMHGSVRHDVIGKGAKVDAKIPGLPKLPSEKAKLQKTFYNLGASLKASYGMMDYGVAADTMFAKKYVGVNGSVNVRVNF
jgi:outer membrane autotransporter protein